MNRRMARNLSQLLLGTAVMLSPALTPAARALDAPASTMGPVDPYLMAERDAEIALARSAAPPAIAGDATVLVMGRHGYETASTGKNGFVCVVERSWMAGFDDPGFWNAKVRGPVCYNPPAARSILPITLKRTELILAGRTKAEIAAATRVALDKKELPALEPGAMCYMMSHEGRIGDGTTAWAPHLMFFVPQMAAAVWGSDQPGAPIFLNSQFNGAPEPVSVFMVVVYKWSDGSPFSAGKHDNH